jgi:hypothetical protein
MAQAGWYSAPGEPGMLRYWSGEVWTDHRQPAPVLVPDVSRAADPYGTAAQTTFAGGGPAQTPTSSHFRETTNVGFTVNGIPVGPGALSQLPDLDDVRDIGFTLANRMHEAQDAASAQPRATALRGAVRSMVVGLILIGIGAALILFFSQQEHVGAGEASVQGTVVSHLGVGSECAPRVQFTVDGRSYLALGGVGGSCSTDLVGSNVTVIYSVADPASTGRYDFGNPTEPLLFGFPLLGLVVFVSGLISFVVRLLRRRSQFAQPGIAP